MPPQQPSLSERPLALVLIFVGALLVYLLPTMLFGFCYLKSHGFESRYDLVLAVARLLGPDQLTLVPLLKFLAGGVASIPLAAGAAGFSTKKQAMLRLFYGLITLVFCVVALSYGMEILVSASHDRLVTQYTEEVYNAFFARASADARDSLMIFGLLIGFTASSAALNK